MRAVVWFVTGVLLLAAGCSPLPTPLPAEPPSVPTETPSLTPLPPTPTEEVLQPLAIVSVEPSMAIPGSLLTLRVSRPVTGSVTVHFTEAGLDRELVMPAVRNTGEGLVLVSAPYVLEPKWLAEGGTLEVRVAVTSSQGEVEKSEAYRRFDLEPLPEVSGPLGAFTLELLHVLELLASDTLNRWQFMGLVYKAADLDVRTQSVTLSITERLRHVDLLAQEVEAVQQDPELELPLGQIGDGPPLVFRQDSLALLDRLLASMVLNLPVASSASLPTPSRSSTTWAASRPEP